MSDLIIKSTTALIIAAGVFVGGFFFGRASVEKDGDKVETKWVGATVSPVITRDYTDLPGVQTALKCMDTSPMEIDKEDLGEDKIRVKAKLCDRSGYRDLEITPRYKKNIIGADILFDFESSAMAVRYGLEYYRKFYDAMYVGGGIVVGGNAVGLKVGLKYMF